MVFPADMNIFTTFRSTAKLLDGTSAIDAPVALYQHMIRPQGGAPVEEIMLWYLGGLAVMVLVLVLPKRDRRPPGSSFISQPKGDGKVSDDLTYDGKERFRIAAGHDVKIPRHGHFKGFYFDKAEIERLTGTRWNEDGDPAKHPQVWFVHPADGKTYRAFTPILHGTNKGKMLCWGEDANF